MATHVLYARTSLGSQDLGLEAQVETLRRRYPDAPIYSEQRSGGKRDRVELTAALQHACRDRAALVVVKCDRLSRSMSHTLNIVEALHQCGGRVIVLEPSIDSSTAEGMMLLTRLAEFAQMERTMISARTRAALAHVDKPLGGRRPAGSSADPEYRPRAERSRTVGRPPDPVLAVRNERILIGARAGNTAETIAAMLGLPEHLVRRIAREAGVSIERKARAK